MPMYLMYNLCITCQLKHCEGHTSFFGINQTLPLSSVLKTIVCMIHCRAVCPASMACCSFAENTARIWAHGHCVTVVTVASRQCLLKSGLCNWAVPNAFSVLIARVDPRMILNSFSREVVTGVILEQRSQSLLGTLRSNLWCFWEVAMRCMMSMHEMPKTAIGSSIHHPERSTVVFFVAPKLGPSPTHEGVPWSRQPSLYILGMGRANREKCEMVTHATCLH